MTAAHVPCFVAFVFLQLYFPVPQSAESVTSYPAACCTLPISLFTTTHSGSNGRQASDGRRTTSRQAGEQHMLVLCNTPQNLLSIILFVQPCFNFSFKSLYRATELEMHDASRICYLLVAVISNVSSICQCLVASISNNDSPSSISHKVHKILFYSMSLENNILLESLGSQRSQIDLHLNILPTCLIYSG